MNPNIFSPATPQAHTQSAPAQPGNPAPSTQGASNVSRATTDRKLPESVTSATLDEDGNPIPTLWQLSPNWRKQPAHIRANWSKVWIEGEIAKDLAERMSAERNQKKKKSDAPATKFTTQAAVEWGKRQKKPSGQSWHVIDRERWERGYKKGVAAQSHDLMLGLDVLFDTGRPGMFGVQAGTPGEEKAHARTFLDRGGPDRARNRYITVYWMAFERGKPDPVEKAEWTETYLQQRFPDLFLPPQPLDLNL